MSNQPTDSLKCFDATPKERIDPLNRRNRLVLYFFKNGFDWCFAGIVAVTGCENAFRSYVSRSIDGNDLLVVSRSGDENAKDNHDVNLMTLHRRKNFRDLVY